MPWRPSEPGEVPTLGWAVLDWIADNLAAPDRIDYEPFIPTPEQARFILNYYALDPVAEKRRIRRAVISRPRGWGKSPFLACIACAEALGPVVLDGWDAHGQPVGMPWGEIRTPLVQIAAVSEDQTKNTWAPLLEMLREGPAVDNYPGLEVLDSMVNLPKGKIEPITSSARTVKGNRSVFVVMDQTEEWVKSNGGLTLANRIRFNAAKVGGSSIESPNAFTPGEGSVAESSAVFAEKIAERKAEGRPYDASLLYDHREAPADTDLDDRESLIAGLTYAYGDSAEPAGGWVDLDRLVAEIWDPSNDVQDSRADLLNQITHATDSWLAAPEWKARAPRAEGAGDDAPGVAVDPIRDGDVIVMGFDGSRKRARGVTDATALIGCRVSDGHLFTIRVWEQPDGPAGDDWQVPTVEVEAEVAGAFARYKVVGMYADPAKWESYVAGWEAKYRKHLKVGRAEHPIEWWMTGGRSALIVRALAQFHSAVIDGELSHDGSSVLTRHVLNARNKRTRSGLQIGKPHPESPNKIDAAIAAVLAWQCRLDALAKGVARRSSGRIRRSR
jgi:hypothetical protein